MIKEVHYRKLSWIGVHVERRRRLDRNGKQKSITQVTTFSLSWCRSSYVHSSIDESTVSNLLVNTTDLISINQHDVSNQRPLSTAYTGQDLLCT